MKKIFLVLILSVATVLTAAAQLGGVLKKAKEKTEKKEEPKEIKTNGNADVKTPAGSNPAAATSPAAGKDDGPFYKTNGTSRPIHQKYLNKIVFAPTKEDIAFEKENEAAFKDKFVFGEPSYCRVYLDNSPSNYILQLFPGADKNKVDASTSFRVHFFFDGVEAYASGMGGNSFDREANQTYTSFRGMIENKKEGRGNYIFASPYHTFLAVLNEKLTPGDHKIRLEVRPFTFYPQETEGKTVASGEFTLTVKPNSIDPNDEDFCLPKEGMKDPKSEAALLKAYLKEGGNTNTKFARITSKEWNLERNRYSGVVLRRTAEAIVVSINERNECVYEIFVISQEFVGGKFEEPTMIGGVGDSGERQINIKCIK